jgi:hypothetical protein
MEEFRVVIGEGVSFFWRPSRICCPLTDMVISRFPGCFLFF